ncbi:MAG: glycine cleavage system aminomethyltransferase GcvT [Candidatus Dormibacteraceae bacterium]
MISGLLRTPLYPCHVATKARMVPFAGWEMPQQYHSVKEEQLAVRGGVGLFDISHMGRLLVRGDGAGEYLQRMTTNDLTRIGEGKAQYTLLCNLDGGIIDDLLVYKGQPWRVVVNGATREKDLDWLRSRLPSAVEISDVTEETALLALQGPGAARLLTTLGVDVKELVSFGFSDFALAGTSVLISRTGYTGEDGFEIWLGASKAVEIWQLLVEAGAVLCGLACRDICRLEAGLRLYGSDMSEQTNPFEVGLGWTVKLNQSEDFCGRLALLEANRLPPRHLIGIQGVDKLIPRAGERLSRG